MPFFDFSRERRGGNWSVENSPAEIIRRMALFPVRYVRRRGAHANDVFNGAEKLYVNAEDRDKLCAQITAMHFAVFKAIELGRPAPIVQVLEQMPPGFAMGVKDGKLVFMLEPPRRQMPKLPMPDIAAIEAAA